MQTNAFRFVHIAIIGTVAGLTLGPATVATTQVHQSSKGALSVDRMKASGLGITLYTQDNDDYFPFSNRGSVNGPGWGNGRPDYTWFELVEMYVGGYSATVSPFDPVSLDERHRDPVNGQLIDPSNPNYWYAVAERTNFALNSNFLSPWVMRNVVGGHYVGSKPTSALLVAQPQKTIMLISSMWHRDAITGLPDGGGNWVVDAPCVKGGDNKALEPLRSFTPLTESWRSYGGWRPGEIKWTEFGAAWPWYENRRFQYLMMDGSARMTDVNTLTAGCDVQRNHAGLAFDGDAYIWDLR